LWSGGRSVKLPGLMVYVGSWVLCPGFMIIRYHLIKELTKTIKEYKFYSVVMVATTIEGKIDE
jgi:hypothetical protein